MVNLRVVSLYATLSYLATYVLAAFHDPGVIRGVNVGGWLLIEQWITPSLFDSTDAVDEWTLCNALGKDKCLSILQEHWDSFFTRQDFVEIKKAGLNALRIPVGYWAVDVQDYEPYVSGQYPYLVRAVNWAQELGLKVTIDLHGAPGSQNGQDNSGLIGPVLFSSNGSNVDRSLNVLHNLTQEFTKDIYGGVVVSIELLNEPRISDAMFPMDTLREFYGNATQLVQGSSSSSLNITYHDAFWGPSYWKSFNPTQPLSFSRLSSPPQRLTLDTHQYYAFSPFNNLPHDEILDHICNISQLLKTSDQTSVPYNVVGEWSLETGSAPNPSSSDQNKDDNQEKRTWLRLMFEAQVLAYSPRGAGESSLGWYFWTWKTEYDIDTWSYRYGLSEGYIPGDVSNASALAYPVLENGCIDAGYNYTAPHRAGNAFISAQKSVIAIWVSAVLLAGCIIL